MNGITMDELKEKIFECHEAEFSYNGCEYSLEAEQMQEGIAAKIWKCSENPMCIADMCIKEKSDFDKLFNKKCFDGKSFYDVAEEIIVSNVF